MGQSVLITHLIEAQYPDYRNLIPKQFQRTATIDRKILLSASERVALFSEGIKAIKLSLKQSAQTMKLEAQSGIGLGDEQVAIELEGGDIDIAFNAVYLSEALRVMRNEKVKLHMNASTSPALIVPESDVAFTHLLMPVQVKS